MMIAAKKHSAIATLSGAPNVNFRKVSVRMTIGDVEFSEHLL